MSDIQIVAEIGCNHNGSVELAKKMMKKAKEAGADAVKFQSFVPENLVSRYAPKAEYQKKNDGNGSQLDMLKKLALTETEYLELVQYASTLDIQIFSTPFDFEYLAVNHFHHFCKKSVRIYGKYHQERLQIFLIYRG